MKPDFKWVINECSEYSDIELKVLKQLLNEIANIFKSRNKKIKKSIAIRWAEKTSLKIVKLMMEEYQIWENELSEMDKEAMEILWWKDSGGIYFPLSRLFYHPELWSIRKTDVTWWRDNYLLLLDDYWIIKLADEDDKFYINSSTFRNKEIKKYFWEIIEETKRLSSEDKAKEELNKVIDLMDYFKVIYLKLRDIEKLYDLVLELESKVKKPYVFLKEDKFHIKWEKLKFELDSSSYLLIKELLKNKPSEWVDMYEIFEKYEWYNWWWNYIKFKDEMKDARKNINRRVKLKTKEEKYVYKDRNSDIIYRKF